ncbi:MAG: hypothetical protein DMG01_22010 [Acidobacteria bacterium]|nr:MAG: hypothetical protein DMG01_22010 [Acidobacteriota bacterium]
MGPTDAECTIACISAHGATYVLYDGKEVYTLSDQRMPEDDPGRVDSRSKVSCAFGRCGAQHPIKERAHHRRHDATQIGPRWR